MATASTKRNRKRRPQPPARAARKAPAVAAAGEALDARTRGEIPERAWTYASWAILLLAGVLRAYAPEMKPLHHDEGVNGFFLMNLLRQGRYVYDPANYHGPTLYYLTLPVVALAGLSTVAIRLVPALFGVGTVWLLLALRRRVGAVAALAAAALVAVSPACVFYSRYFIHEMPFVFFTLGLVVAGLRFRETGSASHLLLAAASAAMMFATKETAFISLGTLGLAWLTALVWETVWGKGRGAEGKRGAAPAGVLARQSAGELAAAVVGAAALFAFIWVAFYSSFFTNWKGAFWDSFKTFNIWKETGMSKFHAAPVHTYLKWLLQEDAPILILGGLGALVALFERRRNRFVVFAAAWGFGLLTAYSLINYKTPWLVLNFIVPLAIAAGYAVQALSRVGWARLIGVLAALALGAYLVAIHGDIPRLILILGCAVLLAALVLSAVWATRGASARWRSALLPAGLALAVCTYQTFVVNFREYDNDRYPYVYSQTQRQTLDLVREIERLGARAGTKEPGVSTASPDYWPLPWYFRDNPRAGFEGQLSSFYDPNSTLAVIGREDQVSQLQRTLGDRYARVGDLYPLRPGVNLVLFGRRDLAVK